jgi:riboflavin synthase
MKRLIEEGDMFTGIIEELGAVKEIEKGLSSATLSLLAKVVLEEMAVGDSLTVNGVCLTVVNFDADSCRMEVSPETLRTTNLGSLKAGDGVNLERAMRLHARLGGHLVSGHVDGVGTITARRQVENASILTIEAPKEILRYCIKKGSVTVDGVSITINDLNDKQFTVSIIPHTAKNTTLGIKGVGAKVNLENDPIAKYVERFLQADDPARPESKINLEFLKKHGYL